MPVLAADDVDSALWLAPAEVLAQADCCCGVIIRVRSSIMRLRGSVRLRLFQAVR